MECEENFIIKSDINIDVTLQSCLIWCSISGTPAMGKRGFGSWSESGRKRVPIKAKALCIYD